MVCEEQLKELGIFNLEKEAITTASTYYIILCEGRRCKFILCPFRVYN